MMGVRAILLVFLLLLQAGFAGAQQDAAAREKSIAPEGFRTGVESMAQPVRAGRSCELRRLTDVQP